MLIRPLVLALPLWYGMLVRPEALNDTVVEQILNVYAFILNE